MPKRCTNIASNYSLYNSLIYKIKEFQDKEINLYPKRNRLDWRVGNAKLIHDTSNEIYFDASKKAHDYKYSLKLFIHELTSEPAYHFDSDGISHKNTGADVKLSDSQIKTPHINYYDENGCLQAMRNDFIEQNEEALKEDIHFGFKFFCDNTKINLGADLPDLLIFNISPFDDLLVNLHDDINFQP